MSENCKKHIKPVSGLNCPAAVLVVNIEKIERKGKYYLSFFSPFIGVFGFFMGFFDIFYLYFNVLAFFADLLHLRHKIQQFLWLFCNSEKFCGVVFLRCDELKHYLTPLLSLRALNAVQCVRNLLTITNAPNDYSRRNRKHMRCYGGSRAVRSL